MVQITESNDRTHRNNSSNTHLWLVCCLIHTQFIKVIATVGFHGVSFIQQVAQQNLEVIKYRA